MIIVVLNFIHKYLGIYMELTSEQIVTKILIENSILKQKKSSNFVSNPEYNLKSYLDNIQFAPSQYGEKYLFVK